MKKTLCITLSLLFTLALSACGKADSPAPAVSGSNPSNFPSVEAATPPVSLITKSPAKSSFTAISFFSESELS